MVQKIIRYVLNAISIVLIVCSVFIMLTVIFTRSGQTPSFFGYSVFRVLTGSMEPEIPVNTMLLVKNCGPEEIKEGDVISFYTMEQEIRGSVVTHRVIKATEENGQRVFITKGDANNVEDTYPVYPEYLIGKVVGKSKLLGKLVRLLLNPVIFLAVIMIPLIFILVTNVKQTVLTVREMELEELKKESEEEASESGADREIIKEPKIRENEENIEK